MTCAFPRRLAAGIFAIVSLSRPALAAPVDVNFKPGTEMAQVVETLAVLGKFNVVVCPGTGTLQTAYASRSVEPADALILLARAHGLEVKTVSGDPLTYAVGKAEDIRQRFETVVSRTLSLRHAAPREVARHLSGQLSGGSSVMISQVEGTPTLILRGPEDTLRRLEILARSLDVALPQARLHLALSVGSPGKLQTVWKGNQVIESGQTATFEIAAPGKPSGNGWRLDKLKGQFTVSVNADAVCTLRGQADAAVDGPAGAVQALISGQAEMRRDAELALGGHELGDDRALTLTARVEVLGMEHVGVNLPRPEGVPPGFPPPVPAGPPPLGPIPPGGGPGDPGSGPLPPSGPPPVGTASPGMLPPPAPLPNIDDPDADLDLSTPGGPPPPPAPPTSAPSPDGKLEIDPEL